VLIFKALLFVSGCLPQPTVQVPSDAELAQCAALESLGTRLRANALSRTDELEDAGVNLAERRGDEEIRRMLNERASPMLSVCCTCFFDRVSRVPPPRVTTGFVDLRFAIDPTGVVTHGEFESDFAEAALPLCVLVAVGSTRFNPGTAENGSFNWGIEEML
jgi:hypothetical protein